MRRYVKLAVDLTWVGLSPLVALLIRDNLSFSSFRLEEIIPYTLVGLFSAALVFPAARLPRRVWRFTSLVDVLHVLTAVTLTLLIALFACFFLNRLDGVARTLPLIQWFLLASAMVGTRVAVRIIGEQADRKHRWLGETQRPTERVLIVGVSEITELYLRSVAAFAHSNLAVAGVLSSDQYLRGHLLRLHKVLGAPEEVQKVISQLESHGVLVDRIVVTQPLYQLSRGAQEALKLIERSSAIKVSYLVESLGLVGDAPIAADAGKTEKRSMPKTEGPPPIVVVNEYASDEGSGRLKRAIDLAAAICLVVVLAPIMAVVALMVLIDVGSPLVFWQQRPGKGGRAFKLFKFRTMRAPHDVGGNRIPENMRSSRVGDFLRRNRLDELPQLYNIIVGEMSFVGPRPLLPVDQSQWGAARLLIRPGLTGWAQVNGGRDISPEDKAALDIWYIAHASFWLDITIIGRTFGVMLRGERLNGDAVKTAQMSLEGTATGASTLDLRRSVEPGV